METVTKNEPIKRLGLNIRYYNALRRADIHTIGDLLRAQEEGKLNSINQIGEIGHKHILENLDNFHIVEIDGNESWAEKVIGETNEIKKDVTTLNKISENASENNSFQKIFDELQYYRSAFNSVFRWQHKILLKQIKLGTLHRHVKFDEIILDDILNNYSSNLLIASKAYSVFLDSTCITEELCHLTNDLSSRDIDILTLYYGFSHKTLDEIGLIHDITRERVRQILSRIKLRLARKVRNVFKEENNQTPPMSLARMQTALLIGKQLGDEITYQNWSDHLVKSGLLGNVRESNFEKHDAIELFLSVCHVLSKLEFQALNIPNNLQFAIDLAADNQPSTPAKHLIILQNLPQKIIREIIRHNRFSGAVQERWLSHEIGFQFEALTDILCALGYTQLTDDWFVSENLQKKSVINRFDSFDHSLRKMFKYCGPLSAENICSGLRHAVSRTRYPVPPSDVIKIILHNSGYAFKEGLWNWEGEMDEELSKGEQVIFKCLEKRGSVVHHSELAQEFIDSELSFASLHATLNRTPLIEKMDYALYKLRGQEVTYDDIERAKNEGDKIPVNLEIRPGRTGIIEIFASLGVLPIGTGVFFSDSLPNLTGDWHCAVGDTMFDDIAVTENEIRGLLKPYEYLNCDLGDRVCMAFNTWDRTLYLKKVQND
jgi:DNA-binding CsgD family transcriptional regulator